MHRLEMLAVVAVCGDHVPRAIGKELDRFCRDIVVRLGIDNERQWKRRLVAIESNE